MRILVTGATGFVGHALIPALLRYGDHVHIAVRNDPVDFPWRAQIRRVGDLANLIDWGPALFGMDAVVHLAAIMPGDPDASEQRYDRINHRATADLAMAAALAGVRRFVFVSSIRAQSGPTSRYILTEDDEPLPTDAFGVSKLAAEMAVRTSRVPYVILRPAPIYGAGVKGEIAEFAQLAALPKSLPYGALSSQRSWLGLDAFVRAVLFALHRLTTLDETFIVADREPLSVADIIATLRHGLGRNSGLVSVPRPLLRGWMRLTGKDDIMRYLERQLVADPGRLIAAGWAPTPDTRAALSSLAWQMLRQST